MVKIRLLRAGAKKKPFYRVIAIDKRAKRNGRALKFLGTYDPRGRPARIRIDLEAIEALRRQGAQVSAAVRSLERRARVQAAQSESAE